MMTSVSDADVGIFKLILESLQVAAVVSLRSSNWNLTVCSKKGTDLRKLYSFHVNVSQYGEHEMQEEMIFEFTV